MKNKTRYKKNVVTVSLCVMALIMSYFYYVDEPPIEKKVTESVNTQEVNYIAKKAPSIMKESILQNEPKLPKEPTLDIALDEEFKGISRLSDKSKNILELAGVLPADVIGKDVVYLEFDLDSLRKLEVGDTFDLEIPQTQEIFTAEVSLVEDFDNGDKSLISNVIGQGGELHTSIITVGSDAMYGQFTTISGNWVFESKNEYGWIAAKRDLYKNHVEFEPGVTGSENTSEDYTISPKK